MKPIYLGFVGPIASGKGLLVGHLKELGFSVYSLSDKVREEAVRRGLLLNRENLQNLGNLLREAYGSQILAERTVFDVIGDPGNIVIDSIRNPGEIRYLRHSMDIKIIGIDAPPELRAEWYLQRAFERGEDTPDMEHFFRSSLRDSGFHEGACGQQVDECLKLADIRFYNGGTKDDILKELDHFLETEYCFDTEIHRRLKER